MEAFQTLTARCLPLLKDDIDTDQIIPARFLTGTTKAGLGKALFYDWHYDPEGRLRPDSLLGDPRYQGSRILIAGHNFGCGSSREHAPWALKDYGFQAILAVSFADIFYNNALKNALLPVALPESVITALAQTVLTQPDVVVTIDLARRTVTLPDGPPVTFEINAFRQKCLLEGLDEIAYVLAHLPQIQAYENERRSGCVIN